MDLLSSPKLYISTTLSDSYKDKSKSTKHRYSLLNHCNRGEVMIKFTKSKLGKFLFLLSFYKTLTESIYTTDILYGFHVSVYIYMLFIQLVQWGQWSWLCTLNHTGYRTWPRMYNKPCLKLLVLSGVHYVHISHNSSAFKHIKYIY